MVPGVISRRVECQRCSLSFSNRWQLNGHMSHHRHADKEKKRYEQLKQNELSKVQSQFGMISISGEEQGDLEIVLLEPYPPFWAFYRKNGMPPKEIDFIKQKRFCRAEQKLTRMKNKEIMGTEAVSMDMDLTLKL